MNLLITGANGFIGKNLVAWLAQQPDVTLFQFDVQNTRAELDAWLAQADFIFHLAGVNRPQTEAEFTTGNVDLTAQICARLVELGRAIPFVLSSSIQAELDNPYGISKRQAEEVIKRYAEQTGARVIIYRLPNVFGKWCRPNYNSVVATFCYNLAHDLPITISDPARELSLVYIDDVVEAFVAEIRDQKSEVRGQRAEVRGWWSEISGQRSVVSGQRSVVTYRNVAPVYHITLGQLAETIRAFRQMRQSLIVPDLSDAFTRKLYGTFVSYFDADNLGYALEQKRDARGALAEFIKSPHVGQIFISRTKPGITRGNHYHHTKAEKFMVIEGEAIIRLRQIRGQRSEDRDQRLEISGQRTEGGDQKADIIEYRVRGEDFRVVDIPPGYTHSIENVGQGELITLFWSSEVLDPQRLDTYALPVQ